VLGGCLYSGSMRVRVSLCVSVCIRGECNTDMHAHVYLGTASEVYTKGVRVSQQCQGRVCEERLRLCVECVGCVRVCANVRV
jgi:hypothetical protein